VATRETVLVIMLLEIVERFSGIKRVYCRLDVGGEQLCSALAQQLLIAAPAHRALLTPQCVEQLFAVSDSCFVIMSNRVPISTSKRAMWHGITSNLCAHCTRRHCRSRRKGEHVATNARSSVSVFLHC
jgi:hypothetical protein